jgi:AraC-like DNA-binding protein
MVVLPRGHAHQLTDHPDTPAILLPELLHGDCGLRAAGASDRGGCCNTPLRHGGGGQPTMLVCGYFRFDRGRIHPLLSVLPPLLLVRGEGGRARPWLESILDLIAAEATTPRAGSEILINRLTEALLIQVIRVHLANAAPSWLAGLRDPQVATALGLLHRQLQRRWTLDRLAAEVGMSRSAFAARFRALVGEPPLHYLTRWRMQVAANQLQEGRLALVEIARSVGYQSEASFSKGFKRLLGVSPGSYRRRYHSIQPTASDPP